MTTVFLDAVFKPFFKIVPDTGQQLTIDRTNFLTDGFRQIIQRTGFVSVNTRFKIPPKEKKNHTLKDRESEGATSRLRNGKWGARETCFEQWSLTLCSTGQVSIATEVANPKEKNSGHLIPPSAYLPSTTHSKDVRFPWVTLYITFYFYPFSSNIFVFLLFSLYPSCPSLASTLALGQTQPPIQRKPGNISLGKAGGDWNWAWTSISWPG